MTLRPSRTIGRGPPAADSNAVPRRRQPPLCAIDRRGQLLGVITLADRVGGMFFSCRIFDLLRCVGDQVAAGLLNAQLSQKLLQAKELEAFQTMSAFFIHDLKNTASTLNLTLQNLPIHFDNPDFREDALRGMAKTCRTHQPSHQPLKPVRQ